MADTVFVRGTTSANSQLMGEGTGDAYRHKKIALQKIEDALSRAGPRFHT